MCIARTRITSWVVYGLVLALEYQRNAGGHPAQNLVTSIHFVPQPTVRQGCLQQMGEPSGLERVYFGIVR